jgi:2-dehydropantoate 2-reductase
MKIAVMGAGAVGCYFGGLLARAGQDVTLIGRAAHVDAIARNGLWVESAAWQQHVGLQAHTEPAFVRGAQIVLCCVKSADTEAVAQAMAAFLAPDACVVSLQNGVDNAQRLAALLPQQVVPAAVYVACEMAGPGHVRHHGRGELVIGPSPQSPALQAAFAAAGVAVQISDRVMDALWTKLTINCAYNALSALADLPYGVLAAGEGVQAVMRDVVQECQAVARASGFELVGDPWDAVQQIARSMAGQRSSTAQDLARGRPTEIDHLNGHIVREGERLGIATPVNRVLWSLVKLKEARR